MASLIFSSRRLVRRLLSSLSCSSPLSAASLLGPSSPLPPAGVSAAACPRRSRSGDSPMESRRPISRVVFFSSQPPHDLTEGPAAIDYGSLLTEDEFHRLADTTINDLQEKFEEFGDDIQIDGFDIDYGNQVLTLKIGELGTYVINKQTPNRQIWLSSPVSGPSRFDWDGTSQAWIYRRTKAKLLQLLEDEFVQLCGKSIDLS